MPIGELAEVIHDAGGIGPKVVGAVFVDEDAAVVIVIVGIAANVVAAVNDKAGLATLGGETLGENGPSKASAYDEEIHGRKSGKAAAKGWEKPKRIFSVFLQNFFCERRESGDSSANSNL